MAQKVYVGGGSNLAQNVKDIYVGVNGVARKVVKGYVGVNGVARQFWGSSPTPITVGSWDHWITVPQVDMLSLKRNGLIHYRFSKRYGGIAYCAFAKYHQNWPYSGALFYIPIIISTSADAVIYKESRMSTYYPVSGSIEDVNGITWYYASGNGYAADDYTPADESSVLPIIYDSNTDILKKGAQQLINLIYATPFQADYQIGNIYNLNATDIKRTIRKVCSTALHRHISWYPTNPAYRTFSDNVNTIIDTIMNKIATQGDENGLIYIDIQVDNAINDTFVGLEVRHGTTTQYGHNVNHVDNVRVDSKNTEYNYDSFNFAGFVVFDWCEDVYVDNSGTITYDTIPISSSFIFYLTGLQPYISYGVQHYRTTNLGTNL